MFLHLTFLVIFALAHQSTAQVPVNDTRFGSFNVQFRYFLYSENVRPVFKGLGTLITLRHVLTAASLVSDLPVNRFVVNVGSTALPGTVDDSEGTTLIEIDIHPDFKNDNNLNANVAVAKVS